MQMEDPGVVRDGISRRSSAAEDKCGPIRNDMEIILVSWPEDTETKQGGVSATLVSLLDHLGFLAPAVGDPGPNPTRLVGRKVVLYQVTM